MKTKDGSTTNQGREDMGAATREMKNRQANQERSNMMKEDGSEKKI